MRGSPLRCKALPEWPSFRRKRLRIALDPSGHGDASGHFREPPTVASDGTSARRRRLGCGRWWGWSGIYGADQRCLTPYRSGNGLPNQRFCLEERFWPVAWRCLGRARWRGTFTRERPRLAGRLGRAKVSQSHIRLDSVTAQTSMRRGFGLTMRQSKLVPIEWTGIKSHIKVNNVETSAGE